MNGSAVNRDFIFLAVKEHFPHDAPKYISVQCGVATQTQGFEDVL